MLAYMGLPPQRISIVSNHMPASSTGLVPPTPSSRARSKQNRGGRDKLGHDPGEMAVLQYTESFGCNIRFYPCVSYPTHLSVTDGAIRRPRDVQSRAGFA